METSENEHTTAQNIWGTANAVLREKFIAIQAYLKKIETSQINNLTQHLKDLKEDRNISKKQPNHTPKRTGEQQSPERVERRK